MGYFADFGKSDSSRYVRVQPATALVILDKLKEADKKNSSFGGLAMNKKDRDKVKLREVVHRQLRFEKRYVALNSFWGGATLVSLLTTILQGPGDSNHNLAQE